MEGIGGALRETCSAAGHGPDDQLAALLDGSDSESFWRQVEANLRSGRVRMVFVADRIPKELRRIVEFLNEQMRPAEVLALEVEQFVSPNGIRTLVPRVLGATERRSEEHTSELQSLMRISYAVFCLKKKTKQQHKITQ